MKSSIMSIVDTVMSSEGLEIVTDQFEDSKGGSPGTSDSLFEFEAFELDGGLPRFLFLTGCTCVPS